ncbi:ATP-binding protein [Amphritea sp. HPY]|uniref:PAS domain-containing sensor histidine kinase n=1 Tax=Amphritea sp. HPY TaxID=3421652 RepID=UPI003D7CFBA9
MPEKKLPQTEPLPEDAAMADEAWVSVIQKMDETYADLVHYQVEIEQKNAELEETQGFLDSVQSSMSDVLIVCDKQGMIQQVNSALEQLTGQGAEQLIGQSFSSLVADDYQQKIASFQSQLRVQPVRDCEVELKSTTGTVPLAMNCSPRKDHRGRMAGMVIVGRPLGELQKAYKDLNHTHAELKLAQERLVQSEKMASLGRLVAGVAHELNNPISFVYGNMHALQRYTDKLVTYFNAINEGASRMALRELREDLRLDKAIQDLNSLVDGTMEGADRVKDIVRDLRQFSSCQETAKTEFDLNHVITTALHWIIKESKRDIELSIDLPEQLTARGHSGQIHQVIVNLIQNAVDAMKQEVEPRLELAAGEDEQRVWFTLRDSGPGLSEENLSRVFDPFFTTKPVGEGTGLGLSISYGIVVEHGGSLTVENHPRGGVLARLELPRDSAVPDTDQEVQDA